MYLHGASTSTRATELAASTASASTSATTLPASTASASTRAKFVRKSRKDKGDHDDESD